MQLFLFFVSTKISDAFLEGFKTSKAAFIITNRYEKVAERLMDELDRGVTGLHAQGMYTEEKKCVLYCVVSRKEIVRVKEIVNDVDSSAFCNRIGCPGGFGRGISGIFG
mgnify:CR=1 FL=1